MKARSRTFPVFYKVLIALAVTGALLAGVILNVLWDFLYSYEKYLPKYVAQGFFEEYFCCDDYKKLYSLGCVSTGVFDGEEQFDSYMKSLVGTRELNFYEMTMGNPEQKVFLIQANKTAEGQKSVDIGTLYLKKTGEKASWGQDRWEYDSFVMEELNTRSVTVKTLSTSTLYLNGIMVPESYVTQKDILTPSCEYMPEGVTGMTYKVYTVDGLICAPEVSLVTKDMKNSTAYYDSKEEIYTETTVYNDELADIYSQFAIETVQTVQRYQTNDTSLRNVRDYVDDSSNYYKYLKNLDTRWYADHIAHEYSDEAVAEFYAYSDEVFSCRYVGTQIITRTKKDIRYFDLDCTLYFKLTDGEFMCYNIIFN
ncbi:MAG: hypothetical protein E7646_00375 [Ruminococcaceae bacterium]|nr:hypothetical protein [Oscillospiraceae bacterium]